MFLASLILIGFQGILVNGQGFEGGHFGGGYGQGFDGGLGGASFGHGNHDFGGLGGGIESGGIGHDFGGIKGIGGHGGHFGGIKKTPYVGSYKTILPYRDEHQWNKEIFSWFEQNIKPYMPKPGEFYNPLEGKTFYRKAPTLNIKRNPITQQVEQITMIFTPYIQRIQPKIIDKVEKVVEYNRPIYKKIKEEAKVISDPFVPIKAITTPIVAPLPKVGHEYGGLGQGVGGLGHGVGGFGQGVGGFGQGVGGFGQGAGGFVGGIGGFKSQGFDQGVLGVEGVKTGGEEAGRGGGIEGSQGVRLPEGLGGLEGGRGGEQEGGAGRPNLERGGGRQEGGAGDEGQVEQRRGRTPLPEQAQRERSARRF